MHEIRTHLVEGATEGVRIFAEDEPGAGGAYDHYRLAVGAPGQETGGNQHLRFQKGPTRNIKEDPARPGAFVDGGPTVNGITNESLIAVVIDRLQAFQSGKFPCRENAITTAKLEEALHWLQARTRNRLSRGVEGQMRV